MKDPYSGTAENLAMTHQQVLKKAIQKAIDGGWNPQLGVLFVGRTPKQVAKYIADSTEPNMFIFNHDFARALWGKTKANAEGPVNRFHNNFVRTFKGPAWQYNLQQMVIADDPIKYLGDDI